MCWALLGHAREGKRMSEKHVLGFRGRSAMRASVTGSASSFCSRTASAFRNALERGTHRWFCHTEWDYRVILERKPNYIRVVFAHLPSSSHEKFLLHDPALGQQSWGMIGIGEYRGNQNIATDVRIALNEIVEVLRS